MIKLNKPVAYSENESMKTYIDQQGNVVDYNIIDYNKCIPMTHELLHTMLYDIQELKTEIEKLKKKK